MVKNKVRLHSI